MISLYEKYLPVLGLINILLLVNDLSRFAEPLRFYENDLRDIIIVFAEKNKQILDVVNNALPSLEMIDKDEKNRLNNLGKDYFDFINAHSLPYFKEIDSFLKAPQNIKFMRMYMNTVSDLQAKIILKRDQYNDFMEIIEGVVDFVVENNESKIRGIRSIVRVFVHFMYFNCDIGKKP